MSDQPDPLDEFESEFAEANESDDADLEQVEHDIEADIASIAAQRDEYLAVVQRLQAEFENYKKQTMKRNTEVVEHASSQLATKLLPVLDAFDNAIIHGVDGIAPVYKALLDVLQKEGLDVIDTDGVVFDPNLHEAVMHEAGEADQTEPIVSDTMRTGFTWKGKVLRPAMVKVRG